MDTARSNIPQSFPSQTFASNPEIYSTKPNPDNPERLLKIAPEVVTGPARLRSRIEIPADEFREIVMFTLASNPDVVRAIIEPMVKAIVREMRDARNSPLPAGEFPGGGPDPQLVSEVLEPTSPISAQLIKPSILIPKPTPELPVPSPVPHRARRPGIPEKPVEETAATDKPAKKRRMDAHKGTKAYKLRKSSEQRKYYDRKIHGLVKPKDALGVPPATVDKDEVSEPGGKEDG